MTSMAEAPTTAQASSTIDVQVVVAQSTQIAHTIRYMDGSWAEWGQVFGVAGKLGGNMMFVGCGTTRVGEANFLQVVCVNNAALKTGLWHTIRFPDGQWQNPWGNVEEAAGTLATLRSTACAGIGGDLHVLAVDTNRSETHIYHTIRRSDGTWLQWGNVEGMAGDAHTLQMVSCAAVGDALHVVVLTEIPFKGKHLLHTIRYADGNWAPWGDIGGVAGQLGGLRWVGCGGTGNELQVVAISNGKCMHTVRNASGGWSPFMEIPGPQGLGFEPWQVSCAGDVNSALHVCASASDGNHLSHTMRVSSGGWTGWGNMENAVGPIRVLMSSISGPR